MIKILFVTIGILMFVSFSYHLCSGDADVDGYAKKSDDIPLHELLSEAVAGDLRSMDILVTRYDELEISARQGNTAAQYCLGVMYIHGTGIKADYGKSKEWFEKAAVQGLAQAQNMLGLMYALGKGVQQNHRKAREWFGEACKNGERFGCEEHARLDRKGY